ncbi:MAG: hypothetical protein M0036_26600 [Desulfobacteraceae bacterium]|nr:hypothetical protein [Desulfobacteraceae bacterium]
MLNAKSDLIERYGRLEMEIQRRMNACCSAFCSVCKSPCCRVEYCREALESPFLEAVRQRFAPAVHWNSDSGWLTAKGCGLAAGRPPVCYEFLCRPILEAQPTPERLEAVKQLAMLVTMAGRRARGNRHVVELEDLERINAARLLAQVTSSSAALARMELIEADRV